MSMILSLIALPISVLIGLKYFGIYNVNNLIPISIALIGALFLIVMQVFAYVLVHTSNGGTTIMGKIIKTVLAVPGILYIVNIFMPINLGFDLEIAVAFFLFTESIYGLH